MSTRAIYAGIRAIGIDDEDDRRALYARVTGKSRLRDMDRRDKDAVLAELRRLEFGAADAQGAGTGRTRYPIAPRGDLRFIHVMWRLLADQGSVRKAGRAGLNAFIRARFEAKWGHVPLDVDQMQEWAEINDVVEALRAMCRRAGIDLTRGGAGA